MVGMKNNQCIYPRGKVLGGSSSINGLMYVRGNRKDYDQWEKLGNKGWNYEEVLPYFIKSENSTIFSNSFHGKHGPINVDYAEPEPVILDTFFQGNRQLGKKCLDYNGQEQLGYSRTQMNIKAGKRESGGTAYIKPVRQRHNLKISTNSLVTKILTKTDSQIQAYGVEFVNRGCTFRARARKEVILSAGAINSPQILKLSGIGPKEELKTFQIPFVKHLPAVGEHMKDHPVYVGLTLRTNYTEVSKSLPEKIKEYLQGIGQLTSTTTISAISFIETKEHPNGVPDIEYIFCPPPAVPPYPQIIYNLKEEMVENYYNKLNLSSDVVIFIMLLHPKSLGRVTLKSANPYDFPDININYFSDRENNDIETMYRGITFILNLTKTDAFRRIQATVDPPVPLCSHLNKTTKEYWYCAIKTFSSTIYHPTGTTRMGKTVADSVVDRHLKVHGVKNLRVADAGVIPSSVSGHTNAAAFMIGERVSDFIKSKYGVLVKSLINKKLLHLWEK